MRRFCSLVCAGVILYGARAVPASDPKAEAREALWSAVRAGDKQAVASILDKGADVNARNEYGITALWIASSKGKTEIIELLLARGADPNARDGIWYQTPLSHSLGKAENVMVLLKGGVKDIDAAVIATARSGNVAVLRLLLETGRVKEEALAAALFATAEDKKEVREALTQAGAMPMRKVSEKDMEEWKPLAGDYENEYGNAVKIEVKETGLVGTSGLIRTAYKRIGPDTFAPLGLEESSLTFERKEGKVTRLISRRFTAETVFYPGGSKLIPKPPSAPKDVGGMRSVVPANWPQFRGIDSTGVADGQDPPLVFDAKTGTNILWKKAIPGLGHSCPVIWNDHLFLTTAIGGKTDIKTGNYGDPKSVEDSSKLKFQVICLDRLSGNILWTRSAHEGVPKIKRHLKGSHANCTVTTDGKRVVACFGAEGLFCYDFEGKQLWKRDLSTLDSSFALEEQYEWGFSASPVLFEDRVILQCDLSKDSFIAAYSLSDGSLLWTTPRDEIPSWSSPVIWRNALRTEIVTNASQYARGYDPRTGKELWRLAKKSEATVPTPVVTPDRAFVASGNRPIQPIFAIRPGASGEISLKPNESSNLSVAWGKLRGGPYMPTPLAYGKYLYTCGNSGMLTCYQAATGEEVYKERIGGGSYTASPVAADGRLYFVSEQGEVRVAKAGPEFELLAVNTVGETCMATPAICGQILYVRTTDSLIAFGRK